MTSTTKSFPASVSGVKKGQKSANRNSATVLITLQNIGNPYGYEGYSDGIGGRVVRAKIQY